MKAPNTKALLLLQINSKMKRQSKWISANTLKMLLDFDKSSWKKLHHHLRAI